MPKNASPIYFCEWKFSSVLEYFPFYSPNQSSCTIWVKSIFLWAYPKIIKFITVTSFIKELLNNISVSMAGEMEISRNSIDIECSFHSTTFVCFEIFRDSFFLFIPIFSLCKWSHIRQIEFMDSITDINIVNFEDIFHIETQHRTRILRKTDI